ncbi:hypothetical protein [Flavobacterium rhizosphaerae]|uniref:DUF4440 domain-containing protein n=1 Tax=Flavobacterium rhizosphaerae TaxID=3163298 RepID=A0ABW8YV42_9FLAO
MKFRFLLSVILFTGWYCRAQQPDADLHKAIMLQANSMAKAFIDKDYDTFFQFTHPAVIRVMGGAEKMKKETIASLKELEKETNVKFLSVNFGELSKIETSGEELQCTFPQMIEMKVPGGRLTAITTLIALSENGGKNWYFIDASGNSLEAMQTLIPSLSPNLQIPEAPDPIFEADNPAPQEKE